MKITALNSEHMKALEEGLELASQLASTEQRLTTQDVQNLYDVVKNHDVEEPIMIIAVGLSFGQIIADSTDYKWVRVKDEYGEETALAPPKLKLACHPISMIQKRLARGESVNIEKLRDETIAAIESQRQSGEIDSRKNWMFWKKHST